MQHIGRDVSHTPFYDYPSTHYPAPAGRHVCPTQRLKIDSASSMRNDNTVVFNKTDSSAALRIPLYHTVLTPFGGAYAIRPYNAFHISDMDSALNLQTP